MSAASLLLGLAASGACTAADSALQLQAQAEAQSLARKAGCMSCHGLVHKQVGPGFAQIAARYRGDAEAPARLVGRIRNGSVGNWGRVIMPRQSQVDEAQAKLLVQWLLSLPSPP
ncbi:c-type cytochrome [Variovorax sp. J22P168]|nr:c-type cytochrome [Variovorax sp. J22P168]MDM0010906.1 c-type cytochrome [Variovorax sp. J22P168]